MRHVQVDMACPMVLHPRHHHLFRRLLEIHRRRWKERKGRNADRPAPLLRDRHDLAGQRSVIDRFQAVPGPRLEDRVRQIRDAEGRVRVGGKLVEADIGVRRIGHDRARSAGRDNEFIVLRGPAGAAVRREIRRRRGVCTQGGPHRHAGRGERDKRADNENTASGLRREYGHVILSCCRLPDIDPEQPRVSTAKTPQTRRCRRP